VARSRGADNLIDYKEDSIRDRVRALTHGKGADVVYDPVGGDAFEQALRAVNWRGRMLVIGFAAGRIQAVPANLILVKNISVIGVVWGAQAERDPALISRNLAKRSLFPMSRTSSEQLPHHHAQTSENSACRITRSTAALCRSGG
jgi:NADPH:quinone reductase